MPTMLLSHSIIARPIELFCSRD